jgi:hypothetical protein
MEGLPSRAWVVAGVPHSFFGITDPAKKSKLPSYYRAFYKITGRITGLNFSHFPKISKIYLPLSKLLDITYIFNYLPKFAQTCQKKILKLVQI